MFRTIGKEGMDLGLDIIDDIGRLDLDSLAGEDLNEDLQNKNQGRWSRDGARDL